jgi:hypothetical protein
MYASTRLRIPFLEQRILTLTVPPAEVWPAIERECQRLAVPTDLMVALLMVESDLWPQHQPGELHALPYRIARRLHAEHAPWELDLELAVLHLACQVERFTSLPRVLLAYHTVADWVAEDGDRLLRIPIHAAYVGSVLTARCWLLYLQSWRSWSEEVAS